MSGREKVNGHLLFPARLSRRGREHRMLQLGARHRAALALPWGVQDLNFRGVGKILGK